MNEKGTIVELFGFKIIPNSAIPNDTVIIVGDIPSDKIKSFKNITDVLIYLLEKEKVYVFNAIEKVGKGFKSEPPSDFKHKPDGKHKQTDQK